LISQVKFQELNHKFHMEIDAVNLDSLICLDLAKQIRMNKKIKVNIKINLKHKIQIIIKIEYSAYLLLFLKFIKINFI